MTATEVLSSAAQQIDQPLRDALNLVRTHLGLDVAFISEFCVGRRYFRYLEAEPQAARFRVGDSDPVEQSLCQWVVDGRLPELMHDAKQHPVAGQLEATMRYPVGAHLSVPIRIDGEVYGTFCCFSRDGNAALDERDLALVRSYADLAGRILANTVRSQRERLALQEVIRRIVDERLFHLVYQPIRAVGSRRIVGHEALTRFDVLPVRSPDRWFNAAAGVGLHGELELAVIRSALADLQRLPADTYLSLNLSPQTIRDYDIGPCFAGLPTDRIMLEVTEHACIDDYGLIAERLAAVRRQGLRLAVDDAGAGYASFRHIIKLQPDVIKLDSSLVASIDHDPGIRALAASLVRFAQETGCKVVAEGVESELELQVLQLLSVDYAQGYLLGRPSRLDHVAADGADALHHSPS